ncbi:hypothetical protein [Halanaerobium sp.]|nr:hypothetical protein [Halanaerobium sp.]PUU87742.1 MAG: hypothetical protein CI949_3408 [Halanaerobium sp.]
MSYYKSREELFSYFNKHSAEKKDELDRHKTLFSWDNLIIQIIMEK